MNDWEYMESVLNVPIKFGLVSQGHIPTIEKMKSEGKTWADIGKAIGWHAPTARGHYQWYLTGKLKKQQTEYYSETGEPVRCRHCDSKELNHIAKEMIAGHVGEYLVQCASCKKEVGYWAYGFYDTGYMKEQENE